MSRVTENGQSASIKYSLNRSKNKLQDLQLKGTTLKKLSKPSDNPVGNVEAMSIASNNSDNFQYIKNADYATLYYNVTEKSLEQLNDMVVKAKEIAIAQSSNLFNPDIRKNIMHEITQIRKQAIAISNKRIGNKYIFGGFKTLKPPFNSDGEYSGDNGHTSVEISKDFFVPINLNGNEVFFIDDTSSTKVEHPLAPFPEIKNSPKGNINIIQEGESDENEEATGRSLASINSKAKNDAIPQKRTNIFALLNSLRIALENDDPQLIQGLLEDFDSASSKFIALRAKVGSLQNSITTSKDILETEILSGKEQKSKLIDADIAELFSDIMKQEAVLKTTYKAGSGLLNQSLLDFLR